MNPLGMVSVRRPAFQRMADLVAVCLLALVATLSHAQSDPGVPPEILWTQPVSDVPLTLDCDPTGNVFSAVFSFQYYGGSKLIKLSPDGRELWSVLFPSGTQVRFANVDSTGNVVVLGRAFARRFRIGTVNLDIGATSGFFIARYANDGRFISVRAAGGFFTVEPLALDGAGNAFVIGQFTGSFVSFCGFPVLNLKNRFFLAKFSRTGAFCWVRPLGSTSYGYGVCVGADPLGNAYVAGTLQGSGLFAGKKVAGRTGCNLFVAKYDPAGRLLWLQQAGSTTNGASLSYTLAVDGTNGCYVCGIFAGQDMVIGDFTLKGTNPEGCCDYDIFLARFSPTGRVLWAKSAGGAGDDRPSILGVAPNGDVLLPGYFTANATVDSLVLTHSCQPGSWQGCRDRDGFLARYSREGELRWAFSIGQPGRDEAIWGPVVSSAGQGYFSGEGPTGFFIARLADWPGTNASSATSLVPPPSAE